MEVSNLCASPLFAGVDKAEAERVLPCLFARRKRYARGDAVLRSGDKTDSLGLVLSGAVDVERCDVWGGRNILARIGRGAVFAETYAVSGEPLTVDAVAAEGTEVLFLRADKLLAPCERACGTHALLARNLAGILASKNLLLSEKMSYLTLRTIRARLLAYLSAQAARYGSHTFTIPFDRQELADYLAVERSALSATLSKMAGEGLITYEKDRFTLHAGGEDG